jgi:hypothetical protein
MPRFAANSYDTGGQLVSLDSPIGVTGGEYMLTPSVASINNVGYPPTIGGQRVTPSSAGSMAQPAISRSGVTPAGANPTAKAAGEKNALSLTHGVAMPAVIMFVVGVLMLHLIFYRKGGK